MGQIIHSDEYYLIEIFDEFFSYLYPDYIHSEKLSKNVDFANISISLIILIVLLVMSFIKPIYQLKLRKRL